MKTYFVYEKNEFSKQFLQPGDKLLMVVNLRVSRKTVRSRYTQQTKIFSSHSRCLPTYGSSQTGLCNKVWPKIRNVEFELFHKWVKLRSCLGMHSAVLDAPYLWPYFLAKSSLGRSIRRYVPWWCFAVHGSHIPNSVDRQLNFKESFRFAQRKMGWLSPVRTKCKSRIFR